MCARTMGYSGMVRRHIAEALGRGEQPVLYGARITGGGSGGDFQSCCRHSLIPSPIS